MDKTFFDKYYWELYNTVNLMNNQAKGGDLLRNHTNYGCATTIAQFLREFGHEVDLRVYGKDEYLVSDCIVIDGKELNMKAEEERNYPLHLERAIKDGYPKKIRGNDGYTACLVDVQPLFGSEYIGVYRYPGGDVCHDLSEIKRSGFVIIEQ